MLVKVSIPWRIPSKLTACQNPELPVMNMFELLWWYAVPHTDREQQLWKLSIWDALEHKRVNAWMPPQTPKLTWHFPESLWEDEFVLLIRTLGRYVWCFGSFISCPSKSSPREIIKSAWENIIPTSPLTVTRVSHESQKWLPGIYIYIHYRGFMGWFQSQPIVPLATSSLCKEKKCKVNVPGHSSAGQGSDLPSLYLEDPGFSISFRQWIFVCPKVLTLQECCLKLDYRMGICPSYSCWYMMKRCTVLGLLAARCHNYWFWTIIYGLWFQAFIFTPNSWNDPIWRAYFSNWWKKTTTGWFTPWPFHPVVGGHQQPLKGSRELTIQKGSPKNWQAVVILMFFFSPS